MIKNDQSAINMLLRIECPGCGSPSSVPLLKLPFDSPPLSNYLTRYYGGRATPSLLEGSSFEVNECTACGLVFQRYVPANSLLSDLYDRWIPNTEREKLRQNSSLKMYRDFAAQVDVVIQYFALPPAKIEMLDFGLGWGEWASVARAFGCTVAGAELSEERKAYARSVGIEIVEPDENIPSRFHFINTEQVFEHLIYPRDVMTHLVESLRPGGVIKISVPNGRGIAEKLRKLKKPPEWPEEILMPIAPLEHINCFDHHSLYKFGNALGLRLMRPSLRCFYNASSGWFDPKSALTNVFRPIYRHIYPKSTFIYFQKPE